MKKTLLSVLCTATIHLFFSVGASFRVNTPAVNRMAIGGTGGVVPSSGAACHLYRK